MVNKDLLLDLDKLTKLKNAKICYFVRWSKKALLSKEDIITIKEYGNFEALKEADALNSYFYGIFMSDFQRLLADEDKLLDSYAELKKEYYSLSRNLDTSKREYEQKIKAITDDLSLQKKLNANLLRICKERSNQARKIPKKSSGFIVLQTKEIAKKEMVNNQGNKRFILRKFWETIIQTPFISSFDADAVSSAVEEKLSNADQKFEMYLNNNFKRNFWEIKIHTQNYFNFDLII